MASPGEDGVQFLAAAWMSGIRDDGEDAARGEEREQVLQNAEQRLSNAFKALSSETLQASQASFLEMASATLAKQQESVQGDLKLRQQAIDSLVKPVAEQLKQVDANKKALLNLSLNKNKKNKKNKDNKEVAL